MSVRRGVFWKKRTVEASRQLDILWLTRKYDLTHYASGDVTWTIGLGKKSTIGLIVWPPDRIELLYTVTEMGGTKHEFDYYVRIETTPCYFGGKRWWFRCPGCNRRCRIIYQPPGARVFACRICHNLTYKSQQEKRWSWFDIIKRAQRLDEKVRQLRNQQRRSKRKR